MDNKELLIIDRISEGIAVIENGDSRFEVPASSLAENVGEGDAVTLENGLYVIDENGTEERRKKIIELQDSLWE